MRTVIIAALLVGTALGINTNSKPVVTPESVARINAMEGATWVASEENGIIKGANAGEIKRLLGAKNIKRPAGYPMRVFTEEERATAIPDSFDAIAHWPNCTTIPYIYDQSDCGSCWAVAGAGAMTDRLCTTGTHRRNEFLSSRSLLSCCWMCGSGCDGGDPSAAWDYWVSTGLLTQDCQPYPFPKCDHHVTGQYPPCGSSEYPTPACAPKCTGNSTSATMTPVKGASSYGISGEEAYQRELMSNGPFEVAFNVYDDFPSYKSGVYKQTSNNFLGGHAVRIIGWGTLNNVKYWKIANSWNTDWGMKGYFLILRGADECGIEDSGVGGHAQ